MTNLKTYIEEREEESREKTWLKPMSIDDVVRFINQTLIGLLEKDIEMMEGMKKITYQLQGIRTIDHRYEKAREYEIWKSGYNQALSDLITGRRKLIEELKK